MNRTALTLLGLLANVAATSCSLPPHRAAWPEPRTLGKNIDAFHAPDKAAASEIRSLPEQPSGDLTLQQALALALIGNPELSAFSWEMRAREANTIQAGLLPNPELSIEMENLGGTHELAGTGGAETTLMLGQLVELGGKRAKRQAVAARERDVAGWEYEVHRINVFTDVTKAFVDVVMIQQRLALAEELVRVAEEALRITEAQVRAGAISAVERSRARVALAASRVDRDNVRRLLTASRQQLAATWGATSASFSSVRGQLDDVISPPPFQTLENRLENNPALARWIAELETRRAQIALADSGRIPDVTVGAGVRRFADTESEAFVVEMSLPLPLFNRNQGAALETRYRLAKAREEKRAVEVRIRKMLAIAYETLAAAYEQVTALRDEVVPQAQAAFRAATNAYRGGRFRYLDALDTQRTLFELRGEHLGALAMYYAAVADVERLVGEPLRTIHDDERKN